MMTETKQTIGDVMRIVPDQSTGLFVRVAIQHLLQFAKKFVVTETSHQGKDAMTII